jgi:hypothetical protein
MEAAVLPLFASRGPFGPAPLGCALVAAFLFGPFLLLPLVARSLLGSEPARWWAVVLTAAGAGGLAYVLLPPGRPPVGSGFWTAWWAAGWVVVALTPVALAKEVVKRGWVTRPG